VSLSLSKNNKRLVLLANKSVPQALNNFKLL